MTTHDGFKVGSGCFNCSICGKRTRIVRGSENEGTELCPNCAFICGHENSHSDNQFPNDDCGDPNCPFKNYTPEQRWWLNTKEGETL